MRLGIAMAASAAVIALGASVASAHAQSPDAAREIPAYRLGAGDKIRVITYGEQALTGEFYVGSIGKVSLPLVGDIDAAGQTLPEFSARVEKALRDGDLLKDPRVSVEVLNYRPFYILGEVNSPGTYPYTNALTVKNAVATAGGFTYRANQKKVFIKRADDSKERDYRLTDTTPVAPGDTIRIGERLF